MSTKSFNLTEQQQITITVALQQAAHQAITEIRKSCDDDVRAYWKSAYDEILAAQRALTPAP